MYVSFGQQDLVSATAQCSAPFDEAAVRRVIKDRTSVSARTITDEMIDSVRGPIPFRLIAARIWVDNPCLNPRLRLSDASRGGLCLTPIQQLVDQFQADPRDPWTSYCHLCFRLQSIARSRYVKYGTMWNELFSPTPIYDTSYNENNWVHLWTRAHTSNAETSSIFERSTWDQLTPAARDFALRYAAVPRRFDHLLRFLSILGLDVLVARGGGGEYAEGYWAGRPYLDEAYKRRWARTSKGELYTVACDVPKPQAVAEALGWPRLLVTDFGFWDMVLLEEVSASPASMEAVWNKLQSGGLARLLGFDDWRVNTAVGYMATWHNTLMFHNLSYALRRIIEAGEPISSTGPSHDSLTAAMARSATILRAYFGRAMNREDRVLIDGRTPFDVSAALQGMRQGEQVTPSTQAWRGAVYTSPASSGGAGGGGAAPGDIVPPGREPPGPKPEEASLFTSKGIAIGLTCLALAGGLYFYSKHRKRNALPAPAEVEE